MVKWDSDNMQTKYAIRVKNNEFAYFTDEVNYTDDGFAEFLTTRKDGSTVKEKVRKEEIASISEKLN